MKDRKPPLSPEECERLSKEGSVQATPGQIRILKQMYWDDGIPMTQEQFEKMADEIVAKNEAAANEAWAKFLAEEAAQKAAKQGKKRTSKE